MTTVTAVLVSHDGARWLPRVLRHLDSQTVEPDRLVAVDTGSSDESVRLLREHLPSTAVVDAGGAGLGAAIRQALRALPPCDPAEVEWVWLLHDDSAPAPDALEHLLAGAARSPEPAVLGPKLREWPSLRRLLEVGVTVSGTGRREVGLERGEYDQGQHDDPRQVLAVGSAGMLVRRDVLEEIGFDDTLPVTWSDVDFGWRVNRAGHVVRTVPAAVVFHADATRTGRRDRGRSSASRRHDDRVGAARTLLANTATARVPLVAVRLLLGGVLRALGLFLVRAPGEAWGELTALPPLLRPLRLRQARRARRTTARVPHSAVQPLLARWWTPYRNGLDELTDVGQAYLRELGGDRASEGTESRQVWRRPTTILVTAVLVLSLWAGRHRWDDGLASVPGMLPPPSSAWAWWDTYLAGTHLVGVGSSASAAPYLLPSAVLATLTWGSATVAAHLVLLLVPPLAAWGAFRLFVRLAPSLPAALLAVGYVLVMATSGALAQGRLGTLVAGAVVPWVVVAAWGLVSEERHVRRRAAWRTALWLWLAASFVPGVLVPAALGALILVVALARRRRPVGAALVPVPVAGLLLAPWSLLGWWGPDGGGWEAWLQEAGSRFPAGVAEPDAWSLLLARPAGLGAAPGWVSAGVVALALLSLLRRTARPAVVVAWLAAVVCLGWGVAALALAAEPLWIGTPLVLAHGALLVAIAAGSSGLREELGGSSFGARQLVGTLGAVVATASLGIGAAWWLLSDPVVDAPLEVPRYMTDAGEEDPAVGTLVLRGRQDTRVTFEVRRGAGPRLGDEALAPAAPREERMAELVGRLVAAPDGEVVRELAGQGIEFVLLPDPVDTALGAELDAAPGLTAASAGDDGARAWRAETEPSLDPLGAGRGAVRKVLLALQLLGLVAVAVLAAPSRRPRG